MATVANLFIRISASSTEFEKSLKGVQAQYKKLGGSLQSIGGDLTKAITLPLAGGAAAAIKFSVDFEKAMTKTVTLAGETSASMEDMKAKVLALAQQTGTGPVQLAEALTAIESNGKTGQEALDILTASAKSSAIGMGEAADVGRALTAVMNAYGDSGLTAAQAADQFHQVVLLGGAEADTLAGELGRVVGVASTLGVSFAEVGAFIATYTRLGLSAAEATTGLSGVLNTILSPSAEARKALAGLGMSAESLRQQVANEGLGAALTGLIEKLHGNEDATGALFGNVRALAGVMGTAGTQAAAYQSNLEKIKNSTGSLNAAFAVWEGTTAATWAKFSAGAQAAAIAVGDRLAPSFSRMLQAAMPLVDLVVKMAEWFSKLPQPVQTTVIGLLAMSAAIGPLTYLVGNLTSAWGAASGLIAKLPGLLAATNGGFAAIGTTILPQIVIIGGLVVIINTLITAFNQLGGAWTNAANAFSKGGIKGVIGELGRNVKDDSWSAFKSWRVDQKMPQGPGTLKDIELVDPMAAVEEQTKKVTAAFAQLGKTGPDALGRTAAKAKELLDFTRVISMADEWNYLDAAMAPSGAPSGLMDTFRNTVGTTSRLKDAANSVMLAGAPDVKSQSEAIAEKYRTQLGNSFSSAFSDFGKDFSDIILHAFTGGGDVGKAIGGLIGERLGQGLVKSLGGKLTGALSGILGSKVGGALGGLLGNLIPGVGGLLGGLLGKIGGLFGRGESKKVNHMRQDFVDAAGGLDALNKHAAAAGVTLDAFLKVSNVKDYEQEVQKLEAAFDALDQRISSTVGEIDKVMGEGGIISSDLWSKILQDKDADAIKAKLIEVFDTSVNQSAEGFNKIAQNFELIKAPLSQIGVLADAAFGGLLANGASVVEAINQLGPGLDHIQEVLANSGQTATGPLADILNYQKIVEANAGIFDLLGGVNDMLVGLANSGLLTQQSFSALGATITQAFTQLTANGVAGTTALQLMQPQLQKLWELQKQFGFAVDSNTQSLLTQAEQQGIVGAQMQTTEQKILDVLIAIGTALGATIPEGLLGLPPIAEQAAAGVSAAFDPATITPKFQAIADAAKGALAQIPTQIPMELRMKLRNETGVELNGINQAISAGIKIQPFAKGGIVTSPTLGMVGEAGPEAIVPLDEWKSGGPTIRIDKVYGTVDRQFVKSIFRVVSEGGDVKTTAQGALR